MKPNAPRKSLRLGRRASQRGAALVEAAVAIPVMLVFLGTTMFVHRAYNEKLAQQSSTRAEVLYHGSHNCEEQAPASMANQLGAGQSGGVQKQGESADTTDGNGGAVDGASGKLRDSEQQGVSRSWNLVKTHRESTVNGSAVLEQKKSTFSRTVYADSEIACNEKRFDNDWTALFGFIKGFAQSGGGFID